MQSSINTCMSNKNKEEESAAVCEHDGDELEQALDGICEGFKGTATVSSTTSLIGFIGVCGLIIMGALVLLALK